MLEFRKLKKENVDILMPYVSVQRTHISDFSVGFQYMWNKALSPDYAFAGDCVVLGEHYAGKYYFHYPLSRSGSEEEEERAIAEIERYCRDRDVRLHFTNVPKSRLAKLVFRYGREVSVFDQRKWRDYLYRAEDFKTYAGGKYAGQRNHVNKFLKNYPDWAFRACVPGDEPSVVAFLKEYEEIQKRKDSYLAREELDEVYDILPHMRELGLFCGILTVGGKIVAFSVGEKCGDTVVVHIEKALRGYEGAYPFIAQQFARKFCGDGVLYLNRMDDAGDAGLRKSKLQYLPCEIVDKYNVTPKRAIDGVSRLPALVGERLRLAPLRGEDGAAYARLCSDAERNRYWGYDYRDDYHGEGVPDAEWFLDLAREDFHAKNEMPLGIYEDGRLIGECVLHRFGYTSEAEIGVRLLPEAEGKGYAAEAVKVYSEYAFMTLGIERLEAKCFRENDRSRRMLLSAGMKACGEDDRFNYFYKTPAM